jgi:hypothetical protein
MTKENPIIEDAPTNNAGGGNIAGLGVGPQGEPGIRPKARKKYKLRNKEGAEARETELSLFRRKQPAALAEETKKGRFAGNDTFVINRKKYLNFLGRSKKDRQWWKTYMGEDDPTLEEIRSYARKNPKAAIVFEDEDTGSCFFARYGGKKK